MRIAVTAAEPHLDAQVDPRFGRCPFFVIVETDDLSFEAIDNENQILGHGAGIQSARLLGERGVQYVLTGSCGPNAYATLIAANIKVIVDCAGTVRSVVEQFVAGRLQFVDAPTVPGHTGMGAGAGPVPPQSPPGTRPGTGPGSGRGRGRGGGMGGGGGRGGGR